jgi:hypothetical protein
MNSQTLLFGLVLIATLIIGWLDSSGFFKQSITSTEISSETVSTNIAPSAPPINPINLTSLPPCAVTLPNGSTPPGEPPSPNHYHGNGSLWALLGRNGVIPISPGYVNSQNLLQHKTAWWRSISGRLEIKGRRLDADAPPLQAEIPDGYGATGVQAVRLLFPSEGCWEVTGNVGEKSLSFVTYVVRVPDCAVTSPNGNTPPGEKASPDFYGNDKLWVGLWPDGLVLIANENKESDGYLSMKFPWWRALYEPLRIEGRRLDAMTAPLRAYIPEGYDGPFQASGLSFPTDGCWEVTGRVGQEALTFITLVVRIHSYPWRTN